MIVVIILAYCALVYAAFRLIKIPVKPITVSAPEGSLFNPLRPAPVALRGGAVGGGGRAGR